MTTRAEAVFENGALRLISPIVLEEGARVEVLILTPATNGHSSAPPSGKTPAEIMAEIAALPLEGDDTPFSGADHDKVLYGEGYGA